MQIMEFEWKDLELERWKENAHVARLLGNSAVKRKCVQWSQAKSHTEEPLGRGGGGGQREARGAADEQGGLGGEWLFCSL